MSFAFCWTFGKHGPVGEEAKPSARPLFFLVVYERLSLACPASALERTVQAPDSLVPRAAWVREDTGCEMLLRDADNK